MNKSKDCRVSLVKSEFLKSFVDLNGVNGSTSVLIKNVEGVSEFVVVFLGQPVFPAGCFGGGWCLGCFNLRSAH